MAIRPIAKRIWRSPAGAGLALVLITGVAALLRLAAINTLPPGLYRDEAYNGLDALQVLRGETPIFFEANNGREPLFIYLLAASVRMWGRSPGALRLVSALIGTLTVPAIYWLGRELFDRGTAMIAAILAVTTVWTLNLSRVAFRAVSMPPLMAGSLALLWQGMRRRQLTRIAWAGVVYGLTFYTYLAARFSAIALLLFIIYMWLWHREVLWARGWATFCVLSLAVFAPLGLYLARHWQTTLSRAAQVSIFGADGLRGPLWDTLARQGWRTVMGFVFRGDFIPRHNIPLRPVFDPLVGLAFVGGVGISLRRARRSPAHGLCLIWLGVMLMPTILAEDAPHMLRGSGILPVLFMFPALGFVGLRRRAAQVPPLHEWRGDQGMSRPRLSRVGPVLIGAALVASSARNVVDYARHLRSEAVYYNFEAGATALAVEANRFLESGWCGAGLVARQRAPGLGRQAWIVPRLWGDWPSVRYLCPDSEALRVLSEGDDLNRSAAEETEVVLFLWPYEDNRGAVSLLPRNRVLSVHEGARERGDLDAQSRLLYVAFRSEPADTAPRNAKATWENGIRLLGYRLASMQDDALLVELYWQAAEPVSDDYTVFCHVLRDGARVGQHDGLPAGGYYLTSQWRAGDIVRDQHLASLSSPCGEGACAVLVGLYRWETGERLVLLDEGGLLPQETTFALR